MSKEVYIEASVEGLKGKVSHGNWANIVKNATIFGFWKPYKAFSIPHAPKMTLHIVICMTI